MDKLVKYLVVGLVVLIAVPLILYPLRKERFYYTTEEGIARIHCNKWGEETMDFYFQYPHFVETHFLDYPTTAGSGVSVDFADGSRFAGDVRVDSQSIDIAGTFTQPNGAEWTYALTRSLNLGGLVGVSGSAEVKMNFTKNNKTYTANVFWTRPAVTGVFLQEGNGKKEKLEEHVFGGMF